MPAAAQHWPQYYTASAFPERTALALAHSPRAAALLVAARLFPSPPPDSGLAVAVEPIGDRFARWEVTWTDGRTRRRIGQFTLVAGMQPTTPEIPTMTNEEKRERRREAALKAARTRAARQATAPPVAEPEPVAPTGPQLVARAQAIGREQDLYYQVHLGRWPHRPSAWTAEQRARLGAFLDGFIRPDGTPQPVPHRKRRTR